MDAPVGRHAVPDWLARVDEVGPRLSRAIEVLSNCPDHDGRVTKALALIYTALLAHLNGGEAIRYDTPGELAEALAVAHGSPMMARRYWLEVDEVLAEMEGER